MGKLIDLTGKRFGRWFVIERAPDKVNGTRHSVMWSCRCDCGTTKVVSGENLKQGFTKSCGCLSVETAAARQRIHGSSGTRLYRIWKGMKERCTYKKHVRYSSYGGRGISVCDEWQNDFQAFYDWSMANGYREELSIDRIDPNGNYTPSNCRWVNIEVQANNKRNNHYIEINGERKTLEDWCKQLNLKHQTVSKRLNLGWSPEEALGLVPRKK